jgi:hypothetical protein
MLHRVANDLLGFKGIVVLNDEAHHCYREKPDSDELGRWRDTPVRRIGDCPPGFDMGTDFIDEAVDVVCLCRRRKFLDFFSARTRPGPLCAASSAAWEPA